MKYVSFELSMPNVGSWNGKWTGESKKYYIVKSVCDRGFNNIYATLLEGKELKSWHYSFGDGWGANVEMQVIDSKEAKLRRKISAGFCGYGWMVDSLLLHDRIIKDYLH